MIIQWNIKINSVHVCRKIKLLVCTVKNALDIVSFSVAGRGGASIYGAEFDDEIHSELKHTGAGILSMANSGPNTNGSQFFITLAQTQWLDGKHTIFGRISSGMSVVKRIGMVEKDPNDRPVDDIKILRAYITPV